MEFYCYSPSETFVVLTADQFVGRDDGLLQQQRYQATSEVSRQLLKRQESERGRKAPKNRSSSV